MYYALVLLDSFATGNALACTVKQKKTCFS